MQELMYEVTFLSDIVLPSTSNTEGNIQNLDFIAGSNFLGMVAKKYDDFEKSFDIFHSGKVRFGDARLLKEDKRTFKMPLSYFFDKGKEETLYNHHLIEDFKEFQQLKQKRNGYITENKEVLYIDYTYSQKSAYDKKNRRSLEGSMFGYSAMQKDLKWQFSIKVDDSISANDLKLLKTTILESNRLGKSKSAQYGLVEIKYLGSEALASAKVAPTEISFLYFKSRVALVDENGNPTYDLKYLCDGLEYKDKDNKLISKIDYQKCQIKTSTFTPYNGAMQTKTYERVVINSASVVVLKHLTAEQLEKIKKGVGAYWAEGFGEILINPSFLSEKAFALGKIEKEQKLDKKIIKGELGLFLQQRENKKKIKLDILTEVDEFISEYKEALYKNIKPSQWGKIRSICRSGAEDFANEIEAYISNGIKKWEENQIDTLLEKCDNLEFIQLLSMQMPKGSKS
jgi:hypothetical protein